MLVPQHTSFIPACGTCACLAKLGEAAEIIPCSFLNVIDPLNLATDCIVLNF